MGPVMALYRTVDQLHRLLAQLAKDLLKVERGNRSAAQRVRVGTLHLQKIGKLFRKESLSAERRGSLKRRKRRAKAA